MTSTNLDCPEQNSRASMLLCSGHLEHEKSRKDVIGAGNSSRTTTFGTIIYTTHSSSERKKNEKRQLMKSPRWQHSILTGPSGHPSVITYLLFEKIRNNFFYESLGIMNLEMESIGHP